MRTFLSNQLSISNTSFSVHAAVNLILENATKIAKSLGIYEQTLYEGHHTMSPYLFTSAEPSRVVDATIWFGSLYYLDDFFGEDIEHDVKADFNILLKCWLEGTYVDNVNHKSLNNLYRSIAYASHQIQSNSPKFFFERYTKGLLEHLKHSLQPTDYQTLEEYIESRVSFGGMYPTMGMIEYTENLYLTNEMYEAVPFLKKIEKDCALIGVLSNDIISYHKEKHSKFNLLNAYLELGNATTLEKATEMSIDLVNEIHYSFEYHKSLILSQLKDLKTTDRKIISTYLNGLSNIVAASYHWQLSTNRYRSEENIFADLRYAVEEGMSIFV